MIQIGLTVAAFASIVSTFAVNAYSATIWWGNNIDIQVSDPVPVGNAPLWAVTLTAAGKNGAKPSVFDSTKSGTGGTGISTTPCSLHQVWEFGVIPTPISTIQSDPIPQQLDSHFLIYSGTFFAGPVAPTENWRKSAPIEDARAGYGDQMIGLFSLRPDLAVWNWSFAYLVVPAGTEVMLDFEIGANGFPSETVTDSFFVIPPPPEFPGDLNYNGQIDRPDFQIAARYFGITMDALPYQGDMNGDGAVTLDDIALMKAEITSPMPTDGLDAPVPEPSGTASILSGAIIVCAAMRRLRRSR
jgi:hypothetical protein